ncbi:CRE-SRH-125 protein [Caenorhabditis remanei]|uniref:CRE-SRH-125 protein n=1 Tax=Caenorhabditis remanei TaxID=31234 RepID=E3LKY4_CAERE|nr:CRE-SRH-125 protein [Caenorhabditis remanei]
MRIACSANFLNFISSPDSLYLICTIIAVTELPFHIIGTYCIISKTPERMKNVKTNMLIKHFSTILMSLSMSFFIIPYMMLPALAGVPLGILSKLGVPVPAQMYIAVTGPAVTGVTILSVFENRFALLTEKIEWRKIRFVYVLLNYLSGLAVFVYPMSQTPDQNSARKELIEWFSNSSHGIPLQNSPCFLELLGSYTNSIFIITRSPMTTAIPMIIEMVLIISQVTLITILIFRSLSNLKFRLSPNTYQLQRKFMKALTVQFILFITALGAPVSVFTFSMLLADYDQGINNLCIIGLSLNGFISTTSMILLHQPYREWIFGVMKNNRVKKTPDRSIAPF